MSSATLWAVGWGGGFLSFFFCISLIPSSIAINFHHTRLSRATNSFTPELHEYINKPDRLLVLYDEDESIAHRAATIFVERGVDNAFLLSGGWCVCVPLPPKKKM